MSNKNQEQAEVQALIAQLTKLTAENEALKAARHKAPGLTFKVSEKGAISVYGVNTKFPVTMYAPVFVRVLARAPEIYQLILDNAAKLSWGRAPGEGASAEDVAKATEAAKAARDATLDACRAALAGQTTATKVA